MDEKCRVFNNEDLADALQLRVQDLASRPSRWMPEIFAFLLELSDDPINKTRIEDLRALELPKPAEPLTWAEILREDPLDNSKGVWDNVNFAEESSIDLSSLDGGSSSPSRSSAASFVSAPGGEHGLRAAKVAPDLAALDTIQRTHKALKKGLGTESSAGGIIISEVQMMREVLAMLQGLPSPLYLQDNDSTVRPNEGFGLQNVSAEALKAVLNGFATISNKLHAMRKLVHGRATTPLVQAYQASLENCLRGVHVELSALEQGLLDAQQWPKTLISLDVDVQRSARLLLYTCSDQETIVGPEDRQSHEILEILYDKVCEAQGLGDRAAYNYTASVFFACLKPYMRSIHLWMTAGELDVTEPSFFIKSTGRDRDRALVWSNMFELVCQQDGKLCAPRFLELASQNILATGKSVHFLRLLGYEQDEAILSQVPEMSFDSVCAYDDPCMLMPFSALFEQAFSTWITQLHRLSSPRLVEVLKSEQGLLEHLDALNYVYLGRNGAVQSHVASRIYDRIKRRKRRWYDECAITDIYQQALSQVNSVDMWRLSAKIDVVDEGKAPPRPIRSLEDLNLEYSLPWAIKTIIPTSSLHVYQRVAVLLLQTECARQSVFSLPPNDTHRFRPFRNTKGSLVLQLRHRLRSFMQSWLSYLSLCVLPSAVTGMNRIVDEAEDLDSMVQGLEAELNQLQQRCLLSESQHSAHQTLLSVLDLALVFPHSYNSLGGYQIEGNKSCDQNEEDLSSDDNASMSESDPDEPYEPPTDMTVAGNLAKFQLLSAKFLKYLRDDDGHEKDDVSRRLLAELDSSV